MDIFHWISVLGCSIKFSLFVGEEPSVVQMLSEISSFLGLETWVQHHIVGAVCKQGAYAPENV